MKRPQTKLHTDIMSNSKVIRSKKSKFIVMSKFSCSRDFRLSICCWNYNNRHRYVFLQV